MPEALNLDESEIEGASLYGRTVEELKVPELKRWLACREASTRGKKSDLVDRVKKYIDPGWDKKIVDPDRRVVNGRSLPRNCSIPANTSAELDQNKENVSENIPFPSDSADWKSIKKGGKSLVPEITLPTIINYFVTRKCKDSRIAGDFSSINSSSYELFKLGHIQKIQVYKPDESAVHLKGVCLPQMKKDRVYEIKMSISERHRNIIYAVCGCPAGKGPCGSCKHIAAFTYALEEFSRLGLYRELVTCTSKLQKWNQPRPRKLEPRCLYDINFKRQKLQQERPENCHTKCGLRPFPTNYSALPVANRYGKEANKKLRSIVESKLPSAAILHCLYDNDCFEEPEVADKDDIPDCNITVDSTDNDSTNTYENISAGNVDTNDSCEDQVNQLMEKLKIPANQITEIEEETRAQSACAKWYEFRKYRLTASFFGKICGKNLLFARKAKSRISIVKSILGEYKSVSIHLEYGKIHEAQTRTDYVKYMNENGHKGLEAFDSGLFIDSEKGWLGATPDAKVIDPSSSNPHGLMEGKAPTSLVGLTKEKAGDVYKHCVYYPESNTLKLLPTSDYYKQVQGQMAISKHMWCDFVIWTPLWINIERINFDENYWIRMLEKLEMFYKQWFGPAVIQRQIKTHAL